MDVKDILTRYQSVPGDIKDRTAQTESVTDVNSDVRVKKEVHNTHQLEYYLVADGASGMSMKLKVNDVKIEDVEQTDCDSKMAPMADVPDTDRPHPVLLVQVKQELDDVDGVCTEHITTVHSDIHIPVYGVSFAEENNNSYDSEVSVKQEVDNIHHWYTDVTDNSSELQISMEINDVKHATNARVEYSSTVSPEAEIGPHTPLPLLSVKIKEEIDDVESRSIMHTRFHTDHMAVPSSEKSHTCVTCSKSFTNKSYLTTHVATQHGDRRHECGTCAQSFTTRGNLTRHMAIVHDGERRYSCVTCMKSFKQKRDHTNHMLVHSGIKPHTCVTCTKTFSRKRTLSSHIVTVHGGERRHTCHACVICAREFAQKSTLARHTSIAHGDEILHTCETCRQSFILKSNLTKHVATVHGDD
jgi:hypothetical protein